MLPTVSQVITKFLYGSSTLPDDFSNEALIRGSSENSSILIDVAEYMQNGPGRFALASSFGLVQQFMTAPRLVLADIFDQRYGGVGDEVVLSKSDMFTIFDLGFYGLSVDQKDWDDGIGNYVERTYVWGNTSFQINNGAEFVISRSYTSNGTAVYEPRLSNFAVEPLRAENGTGAYNGEDFDFKSAPDDWVTDATQTVSERAIDPSGIGRIVYLEFNDSPLPLNEYTYSDYLNDQQKAESWYSAFEASPSKVANLASGVQELFDDLFASGVTATLVDDKLVIYGTRGDDTLHSPTTVEGYNTTDETASVLSFFGLDIFNFDLPHHAKTQEGYVLLGGTGDDRITDGLSSLPADADPNVDPAIYFSNDIIFSGDGDDIVYLGGGSDVVSLGEGDDEIHFSDNPYTIPKSVIWGGIGADSFYFERDARVLLINVPTVTREVLINLSTEALFEHLRQPESLPYNYIVINMEAADKVFFGGTQLSSVNVTTEVQVNASEEWGFDYELTSTDAEGWKTYTAIARNKYEDTTTYRKFQVQNTNIFGELNNGTFANGNYSGNTAKFYSPSDFEKQLIIDGFTDGSGSIHFIGDGLIQEESFTETRQPITPLTANIWYTTADKTIYKRPVEYDVAGDAVVTVEHFPGDYSLKPEGYGAAGRPTINLSEFQLTPGTDPEEDGRNLNGGADAEQMEGSAGVDRVNYTGSTAGVDVNLTTNVGSGGYAQGDSYVSIENVTGSAYDDTLSGNAVANVLKGGAGNDVLYGGVGNDTLDGESGTNNQANYDGFSTDYVFTRNANGTTTVTNTTYGTDTLANIQGVWFLGAAAWSNLTKLHTNAGSNTINGTSGDDYIVGTQAGDVIYGGDGNDVLYGGLGDDTLKGDGGTHNQVDYDGTASDYLFTLNTNGTTTVTSAVYGTDVLSDIDGIWFRGAGAYANLTSLHANGWVGASDTITTTSGVSVELNLTANDSLPAGANVVQYIWTQPAHGTVYWDATENSYIYVPDTGFTGTDTLIYGLHDGNNGDAVMTPNGVSVTITVNAGNPNQGETVTVGNGNAYYGGSTLNDTINFAGGSGNYVNGDDGDDIIVFSGSSLDYKILGQGDHFTIQHLTNGDAIQFTEIEDVGFSNGTISLDQIVANSGYNPGDTWSEPEPIGGLV